MSSAPLLTIHTDGASRGNPGAAAFAYIIDQPNEPAIEEAGCLGQMTNNQAEYTALVRALEHALRLGPEHRVHVHADSELMVKQMKGEYKVKNSELRDLYRQARDLADQFHGGVSFQHVRRGDNKRADALCNEALDGRRRPAASRSAHAPVAAAKPQLHEQAIACLREAAAYPNAEEVWQQLVKILTRHGVVLPPE